MRGEDRILAGELERLLDLHDFAGTYAGIVAAFGLSASRLTDAVATLTIVVWIAANYSGDPSSDQVDDVISLIYVIGLFIDVWRSQLQLRIVSRFGPSR